MPYENAKFKNLPLDLIIPTPDNPRDKIKANDPEIIELAESIKELGVLDPVLCRPHPTEKGKYDLRAGERRWIAAQIADLDVIPALVCEWTDAQAFGVTMVENLQRANLTPMEAARGVRAMLDGGLTYAQIGAELGKSARWVAARAQLTHLTDAWKKTIADPESFAHGYSAGHLELIARLEPETQDMYLERTYHDDSPTLEALAQDLANFTMTVGKAPWNPNDEALHPAAGACAVCGKRASKKPLLFPEDDPEPDPKKALKKDRCLDMACWQAKLAAHIEKKKAEHQEIYGKDLILLSSRYGQAMPKGAVSHNTLETRCKKSEPGARPGFHLDGPEAGHLVWCRPYGAVSSHSSRPRGADGKPEPLPIAERRKKLERRRNLLAIKTVQEWLVNTAANAGAPFLDDAAIVRAAVELGVREEMNNEQLGKIWKRICPPNWKTKPDLPLAMDQLRDSLRPILSEYINPNAYAEKIDLEPADMVCTFMGWSILDFLAIANREIPEPKSWASEVKEQKQGKRRGDHASRPRSDAAAEKIISESEAE